MTCQTQHVFVHLPPNATSVHIMPEVSSPNLVEWLNERMSKASNGASLALPSDGYGNFKYYSARELGELADKAATHLVMDGISVRKANEKPLIIGIYAPSTISWAASCFGILRMGHAVLVLSSRLPDASVSALVDKSGCDVLLHGARQPQLDAAQVVKMVKILSAELLEAVSLTDNVHCDPNIINADTDLVFITHSSGSTALPKLFPLTHAGAAFRLQPAWLAIMSPSDKRIYVASAFYNVVGFWSMITCVSKAMPTIYDSDVLPFTSESLVNSMKETQPHHARVNPYSLQLIAAKPEGLAELKKCARVTCFGAIIPQELGDRVVQAGIRLDSSYGSTEAGVVLDSCFRPQDDLDWEYLVPLPSVKNHVYFKPIESAGTEAGMFELVALATHPDLDPSVAKSDDPPGSYYTGDIFLAHPTKPDRWKVIGRKDDQLKIYVDDRQMIVDACVYENKIKESIQDVVEEVVLFGQGRDRLGLLTFAQHATDSQRDVVLERVWEAIEQKINGTFKAGIKRDMIVLVCGMSAEGALARTSKLNFIRPQAYLRYKQLIDEAYEQSETENAAGRAGDSNEVPSAANDTHTNVASERGHVHL